MATKAKSIETLSASECAKALAEIEGRLAEIRERAEALKPPSPTPPATNGPAAPRDPLHGAGPEFAAAVASDDPGDLVAVRVEYERLSAEADQLLYRRELLQRRQRQAADEERQKAAPKVAAKLMKALPAALDKVDSALENLAAAIEARDELVRELDQARGLTGGEPHYSPELLRRIWVQTGVERPLTAHALRPHVSTSTEPLDIAGENIGGGKVVKARFLADVRSRLAPPSKGIVGALAKVWGKQAAGDDASRRLIDSERARLIAAGELDALDDSDAIARAAAEAGAPASARRDFATRST